DVDGVPDECEPAAVGRNGALVDGGGVALETQVLLAGVRVEDVNEAAHAGFVAPADDGATVGRRDEAGEALEGLATHLPPVADRAGPAVEGVNALSGRHPQGAAQSIDIERAQEIREFSRAPAVRPAVRVPQFNGCEYTQEPEGETGE